MKIRKLQLKNIGVFDDETIKFQSCPVKNKAEIHIFTGQNGSGKTTILQALASAFYGWKEDWEESEAAESEIEELPLLVNTERSLFKRFRFFEENEIGFKSSIIVSTDEYLRTYEITEDEDDEDIDFLKSEAITISGFPEDWYGVKEIRSTTDSVEISNYKALVSSDNSAMIDFAVFAYSGYRQIISERVEAIKEPQNLNPLYQSLEFIKDYSQSNQLTINQLIANNISKSAIESRRNPKKSERFANVVKAIEQAISEITGLKVEFDLQTEPTNLVTKINDEELDFDVLPDGLRSLISWIADLLGRVDLLKWQDDLPIFEKNLILFLDEIEVHLHPAWQRKVLPVVQKLFKNSQIFVSTHSPFVVNSIDDAWVYKLELENGKAKVSEIVESENSYSISQVLRDVFGIDEKFGKEVQDKLDKFEKLRDEVLTNGSDIKDEKKLLQLAKSLSDEPSDELKQIILDELRQISKIKGKEYSL